MWGDAILFAGEEDNNATWCGEPGRQCMNCTAHASNNDDACADRMVSTELAVGLSRLMKFVQAEWPDSKYLQLITCK